MKSLFFLFHFFQFEGKISAGSKPEKNRITSYNVCYTKLLRMLAKKSAVGILYQTPLTPQICGKIMSPGTRNISCLDSDMKIDFLAKPILWKKLDVTI